MTILRETARILTGEPTASSARVAYSEVCHLVTAFMMPRYQPARARSDPPEWRINDLAAVPERRRLGEDASLAMLGRR
jgi:hypothetical protein